MDMMLRAKNRLLRLACIVTAASSAACGPMENIDLRSNAEASESDDAYALGGNGMPSGAHYQVNIIGVPKGKSADMSGNDGRRIFVPLAGKVQINLLEGAFGVLDANGTDGSASFRLPAPVQDGQQVYEVYARALGKPGGSSTTTTCGSVDGETYCSVNSLQMSRVAGKPKGINVSKTLLYLDVDMDGDGVTEQYPLFDSTFEDYWWDYDNNGLRVLQLRFYAK
jgi:hypothetical protein